MNERILVNKPWGSEYLIYENSKVAIWMLNIDFNHSTSFHCHPYKKTGLIILNGVASIELGFQETRKLTSPGKLMIRPGLFHSTKALSNGGIQLLELETPVDKEDLVRYSDGYGREDKPIEGNEAFVELKPDAMMFNEPEIGKQQHYEIGSSIVSLEKHKSLDELKFKNKDTIIAVIDGGLSTKDGRFVLSPGDIVNTPTIEKLADVFEVANYISYLVINKNES